MKLSPVKFGFKKHKMNNNDEDGTTDPISLIRNF